MLWLLCFFYWSLPSDSPQRFKFKRETVQMWSNVLREFTSRRNITIVIWLSTVVHIQGRKITNVIRLTTKFYILKRIITNVTLFWFSVPIMSPPVTTTLILSIISSFDAAGTVDHDSPILPIVWSFD